MDPAAGDEGTTRTSKKSASTRATTRKAGSRKPRRARSKTPPAPAAKLDVDPDVLEFIDALDRYRHAHDRPFPSWSEVLHVVRWLGYRKD